MGTCFKFRYICTYQYNYEKIIETLISSFLDVGNYLMMYEIGLSTMCGWYIYMVVSIILVEKV